MKRLLSFARCTAAAWLLLAAGVCAAEPLRVYFFDVGQGDSELIISPTGRKVLIDAGPPEATARLVDRLQQLVSTPLDLVILTHAHLDHLGGMERAITALGARFFMDSGFKSASPGFEHLLEVLKDKKVPVKDAVVGRRVELGGGAVLTVLAPSQPFFEHTRSDANSNSVIVKLTYGKARMLFEGDAEAETEKRLIDDRVDLGADVLKVAHHGSHYATTPQLVRAVRPKIAVISCGAGNEYGHPNRSTIDRLEEAGAAVYRTDLDGEVQVITDGQRVEVRTASEAHQDQATRLDDGPAAQDTGAAEKPEPYYVGSRKSDLFHRPGCRSAARIFPANLMRFKTRETALASHRHPASDCNP